VVIILAVRGHVITRAVVRPHFPFFFSLVHFFLLTHCALFFAAVALSFHREGIGIPVAVPIGCRHEIELDAPSPRLRRGYVGADGIIIDV
jgi:hypothetical protein